ncbi:sugar phosphate isomerase/epimerase family protein [Vibrio astriarenae]|uniref:sugar phosphate isomerase/epimerase family protein n=1 Tax=Vibrio astriarenae TaxID=1481923 RepID=UPI0037352DBB
MLENYSVSTVAYAGHSVEDAIKSLARIGVRNVEVALIQGAIYELDESMINSDYAILIRSVLSWNNMKCTSIAAHCEMTVENCADLLLRRVELCIALSCSRLILYAPREVSWSKFFSEARRAFELARTSGIKILIENVGDRKSYLLNDARDFTQFLSDVDTSVVGINFDPGNFLSHRPELDVLAHSIASLSVAEHLHLKDLTLVEGVWQCCDIGYGQGNYRRLLVHAFTNKCMPFFSLEQPLMLERDLYGRTRLKSQKQLMSIADIESRLKRSIQTINECYELSSVEC